MESASFNKKNLLKKMCKTSYQVEAIHYEVEENPTNRYKSKMTDRERRVELAALPGDTDSVQVAHNGL